MDEMVLCPVCKNEVAESDICEEHGVCLWCDEDCKRSQAAGTDD